MSPLKAAGSFAEQQIGKFIDPIWGPTKSALTRAVTLPGMGGANVPPPPPPAQSPIGQRPKAGGQTSFLSSATQAGLAASMSGSATGKTLLGQ